MTRDPIVEEVRAIRDAYAKAQGYDVDKIITALQRDEVLSGRKFTKLPIQHVSVPAEPEKKSA